MITAARMGTRMEAVPARSDPDAALALARAGDAAAFAAIVRRHQSMVFSLALHMLRSRAAAEDLAQDVFLELFRALPRLESDAHVTSWLRRVASHRCIDEIRRRQHRPEFGMDELPDRGVAPASRELFLEERVQRLLAELPARARMVVVLRFQEELDPSDIADALDMSINTVKSHLRRSLAALRASLAADRGGAAPAPVKPTKRPGPRRGWPASQEEEP